MRTRPVRWLVALILAVAPLALAEDGTPVVSAVVGGVTTMSGDAGTAVTPVMYIDVESCFAIGSKCPFDFYGRIGISSAPGASVNLGDPKTFKSAEVGFGISRRVGVAGGVITSLVIEGGFITRLPDDPDPLQRVAHYLVVGGSIKAKSNGNSLTIGVGRDQLADVNSGPLFLKQAKGLQGVLYGSIDVPSTNGVVTLLGDATVNVIVPKDAPKRDIVRIGVGIDVARMIAVGKIPPAAPPVARPAAVSQDPNFVGPPQNGVTR